MKATKVTRITDPVVLAVMPFLGYATGRIFGFVWGLTHTLRLARKKSS